MILKGKDVYRVEVTENLSEDALTSLVSLYLPIIGGDAVLLYLLLHSEGRLQHTQESHLRLFELLGLPPDQTEQARIHLEERLLLRTYVQEGESRNSYIYRLNAPLPTRSFLQSSDFMAMYAHAVNQKQLDITSAKLSYGEISTEGYQDITSVISRLPTEQDYEMAVGFQKVRPRYRFSRDELSSGFDYEQFFLVTSDFVFPNILRTRTNLEEIGRLATLYGLSPERMCILVGHCTKLDPPSLDLERLKKASASAAPDVTSAKDAYSLPPVSFLMSKQHGAAVSAADKRILEKLSSDMHFPNDVINIMIEYILKISDNRLNSRFVDMVAGEWARDGVKDRESALAETRKPRVSNVRAGRKEVLPEYYNAEPIRNKNVVPASKEKIEAAKKLLNQSGKGKNHGGTS